MQLNMGLIWIGALLVLGGVLFTAAKALGRGRLSGARSARQGYASDTLEPKGESARFPLRAIWPGLVLLALGALLLLAGAMAWTPET
jgi:hypothetical protein